MKKKTGKIIQPNGYLIRAPIPARKPASAEYISPILSARFECRFGLSAAWLSGSFACCSKLTRHESRQLNTSSKKVVPSPEMAKRQSKSVPRSRTVERIAVRKSKRRRARKKLKPATTSSRIWLKAEMMKSGLYRRNALDWTGRPSSALGSLADVLQNLFLRSTR